jgi:DNA repair protein RecO (recombination protein O)
MTNQFLNAFLIHRRPFQENGLLLDFFTLEQGMVRCVSKYSRKSRSPIPSFMRLNILFTGKSELKSLREWEVNKSFIALKSQDRLLVLYINELLYRLLQTTEESEDIFEKYQELIEFLPTLTTSNKHWMLRLFENSLLKNLGFGVAYNVDSENQTIEKNKNYTFQDGVGFIALEQGIFSGEMLLYLDKNLLDNCPNDILLKQCRNLFRSRLANLLGHKPLKTRELFR